MRGLESKAITNFYGAPGTGKTNLCLLVAADCARKGGRVIFIDTEGGFSLERLKQIAPNDYGEVLKGIELVEPKSLKEQTGVVRGIRERKPNLVVLDSSVALYRVECAEVKEGRKRPENDAVMAANRELSKQLSILSVLARENNIPVIITAHAFRSWGDGSYDVVGGDAIRYWSKAIVYLEKTGRTSERKATVIKHRSLPEGGSVKFMLVQDGIKPSGFKIF
ncbi:MAG: DNA repair and recombination protein RadB [Candidatus Aenigmatarchaeota archaeon]|nr:MAG: DNA repair and recombination protein RadB [Candidatus Aenigmarchaeota archaeon]